MEHHDHHGIYQKNKLSSGRFIKAFYNTSMPDRLNFLHGLVQIVNGGLDLFFHPDNLGSQLMNHLYHPATKSNTEKQRPI